MTLQYLLNQGKFETDTTRYWNYGDRRAEMMKFVSNAYNFVVLNPVKVFRI